MHFTLPLPPTLNHAYRSFVASGNRPALYKTAKAKAWQNEARFLIYSQDNKQPKYARPVNVVVNMFLKYNRDIDSSLKLLLDTFETAGIVENDKWIYSLSVTKEMKAKEPRMEVTVNDICTG